MPFSKESSYRSDGPVILKYQPSVSEPANSTLTFLNMKLPKRLITFFGDKGLSMSEANHQANMTKEIAEAVGRELSNLSSVHEVMDHENGKTVTLDNNKAVDLEVIKDLAQKEGKLYALSAWLREAVKAKATLLQLAKAAPNVSFMEAEEKFPTLGEQPPVFIAPEKPALKTEDDVIGEFSIKERADYLILEATAAHLGKKIHQGGNLSNIRKELLEFVPVRFKELRTGGQGPKDYPVNRTKLYEPADFDKLFFSLQATHREAEQQLNGYKARIQNEITVYNAQVEKDYSVKYNEARVTHDKLQQEYNLKNQSVQKEQQAFLGLLEGRRLDKIKEISEWKVIVPVDLEETLTYVKEYSK